MQKKPKANADVYLLDREEFFHECDQAAARIASSAEAFLLAIGGARATTTYARCAQRIRDTSGRHDFLAALCLAGMLSFWRTTRAASMMDDVERYEH